MRRVNVLILGLMAAALLIGLAGCGGGGGSSSSAGDTGRITGRVDQSVSRAATDAVTVSVDGTGLSATAGADGKFTLDSVPVGLHTLVASSSHGAAALVAQVAKGTETSVGDLVLGDAGQVSGLVTSSTTHQPVQNALVTVVQFVTTAPADAQPLPVRTTHTDANGSYTVSGLPLGAYLVGVSSAGFDPLARFIRVSGGSTAAGDVALSPSDPSTKGSVSGTVSVQSDDGTTAPLSGVLIHAAPSAQPAPVQPLPAMAVGDGGALMQIYPTEAAATPVKDYFAFTDEKGTYTLGGLAAGTYNVVAIRPGLDPDQKSAAVAAGAAASADFTLKPHHARIGTVTGIVTSTKDGTPIKGAQVTVMLTPPPLIGQGAPPPLGSGGAQPAGGGSAGGVAVFVTPRDVALGATTDDQGRYSLKATAGRRTLAFYADGFTPKSGTVDVSAGSEASLNVGLDPAPGAVTLSGHVLATDSSGKTSPVAGGTVVAAGPVFDNPAIMAPLYAHQATTNDKGEYSFSLPAARYIVSAYKDSRGSGIVTLALTQNTTQDLILRTAIPTVPPPQSAPANRTKATAQLASR